jgi:hypothetical protein
LVVVIEEEEDWMLEDGVSGGVRSGGMRRR